MKHTAVQEILAWAEQLGHRKWRGLCWLSGPVESTRHRATALWGAREWQSPCWVSPTTPEGVEGLIWLPPGKARTRLGQEHDLIIFDALDVGAFDADAFGALSGTLRAGAILILLTPPPGSSSPAQLKSRYLARLLQRLSCAPGVTHWGESESPALPALSDPPRCDSIRRAASLDQNCLTADQAGAVERLVRLRRRRPLVLTADRGRGKTAALGIACARLLAVGTSHIWVTAPRPEAVAALFERLEALCPQGQRQGNRFVEADGGSVDFVAPDELSAKVERGEVGGHGSRLLVDEAAAIPAAMLGQWLAAFPRIAFATTVHGYEGSGRGFALRFRERLERQTPDWQQYHLAAPIRWSASDLLEPLVNQLLLLDADPPATVPQAPLSLQRWQQAELAADEQALRAVFGLLVQAHYRTRPNDLQRLLDDPGVSITTLEQAGQAVAVSLCIEEGGFPAELAESVARGERRPQGHLLAQSLAAHAGSRCALTSRVRRIMRIAVHGAVRRQGLGRRLLDIEYQRARDDGIDLLGASFGADPGLMAFWKEAGFQTVRLGLSRETSTGEHALMVVAATSNAGREITADLVHCFQALLPLLLAFELRKLAPEVAMALLAEGQAKPLNTMLHRELDDVALGRREPGLARPALQQLVRRGLAAGAAQDADAWLLVAWLFQHRDSAWLAARLGLSGRREVVIRLREALRRWRHWAL